MKIITPIIALAAVAGAAIATPIASGLFLEHKLQALTEQYNLQNKDYGISLSSEIERGLFSSQAQIQMHVDGKVLATQIDPQASKELQANPVFQALTKSPICIDYQFQHTGLAGFAIASYQATPCFSGELQKIAQGLWPDQPAFTSQGSLSFIGTWNDVTQIPATSISHDAQLTNIAATEITSNLNARQLLNWQLNNAGISYSDSSFEFSMGPIAIEAQQDLAEDPMLGNQSLQAKLGNMLFVDKVVDLSSELSNLRIHVEQISAGGTINGSFSISADSLKVPASGIDAEQLHLQQSFHNIDAVRINQVIQQVSPFTGDSEKLQQAIEEAQPLINEIAKAQPRLAIDDLSLMLNGELQKLSASISYIGDGSLKNVKVRRDFNAKLDIQISKAPVVDFLNQLNMDEALVFTNDINKAQQQAEALSLQQIQAAIMMGFLTEKRGQLNSNFSIEDGNATLNGESINPMLDQISNSL